MLILIPVFKVAVCLCLFVLYHMAPKNKPDASAGAKNKKENELCKTNSDCSDTILYGTF